MSGPKVAIRAGKGRKGGRKERRKEGRKEGRKRGREEGRKEERKERKQRKRGRFVTLSFAPTDRRETHCGLRGARSR